MKRKWMADQSAGGGRWRSEGTRELENGVSIRVGVLSRADGSGRWKTPMCLAETESGWVPNLSKSQCESLPSMGLTISASHFHASWASIQSTPGGLKQYCAVPGSFWVHLSPGPVSAVASIPGGKAQVPFFESPSGRFSLDPVEYADMLKAAAADSFSPLSWSPSSAPGVASKNTIRKSVEKTPQWALETRQALIGLELQEAADTATLVLVGGGDLSDRQTAVERSRDLYLPFAVEISGLSTGESPSARLQIIQTCLKTFPESIPRYLPGIGSPAAVLACLEQGVDIFSTDYPTMTTEWGLALVFSFDKAAEAQKINLRDPLFLTDGAPLVEGCPCYTCQKHCRSYIHHLLNVHEMLAFTLLQLHNWSHYLNWFAWLRGE